MEKMLVVAPKGKTCPMERSRSLIGDAGETQVPNNHYYRSRIAYGELVFCGHVGQPVAVSVKSTVERKPRGGSK
jgi:hypothetical protein